VARSAALGGFSMGVVWMRSPVLTVGVAGKEAEIFLQYQRKDEWTTMHCREAASCSWGSLSIAKLEGNRQKHWPRDYEQKHGA
jgi:hypothetical protein